MAHTKLTTQEMYNLGDCDSKKMVCHFNFAQINDFYYESFFHALPNIIYKKANKLEFSGNYQIARDPKDKILKQSIAIGHPRYFPYLQKIFCSVLPISKRLKSLVLSNIDIPQYRIRVLFDTILESNSIIKFRMQNIPVAIEDLHHFLERASPYHYEVLAFVNANLSPKIVKYISKFLNKPPEEPNLPWALNQFDIEGNNFPIDKIDEIEDLIQSHFRLYEEEEEEEEFLSENENEIEQNANKISILNSNKDPYDKEMEEKVQKNSDVKIQTDSEEDLEDEVDQQEEEEYSEHSTEENSQVEQNDHLLEENNTSEENQQNGNDISKSEHSHSLAEQSDQYSIEEEESDNSVEEEEMGPYNALPKQRRDSRFVHLLTNKHCPSLRPSEMKFENPPENKLSSSSSHISFDDEEATPKNEQNISENNKEESIQNSILIHDMNSHSSDLCESSSEKKKVDNANIDVDEDSINVTAKQNHYQLFFESDHSNEQPNQINNQISDDNYNDILDNLGNRGSRRPSMSNANNDFDLSEDDLNF